MSEETDEIKRVAPIILSAIVEKEIAAFNELKKGEYETPHGRKISHTAFTQTALTLTIMLYAIAVIQSFIKWFRPPLRA